MKAQRTGQFTQGEHYHIRIGQHLDPDCSAWLAGMTITNLDGGEAVLSGRLVDQSALYGVLQTLHDMNVTLLEVRRGNHLNPNLS
jgi:hypothetical protein